MNLNSLLSFFFNSIFPVSMGPNDVLTTTSLLYSALSEECTNRLQQPNFVFSPFSILGVFHVAQSGAEGETKKEMDSLLPSDASFRLPSFDVPSVDGTQDISVESATRIYAHKALEGNEYFNNFDKEIRAEMGAEAGTLNFGNSSAAAAEINDYIKKKTRGRIDKLLEPSTLSDATRMVLVNALYFKAPWSSRFDKEDTIEGVFHARTPQGEELEDQRVLFMYQQLKKGYTYYKSKDVTALSLNYSDYRLRLFIFMPTNFDSFERKMKKNPKMLEEITSQVKHAYLENTWLNLRIPKFKLTADKNKFDLTKIFASLGIKRMFNEKEADFSRMTGEKGDVHVSVYVHRADLEINEEGTEASAATGMIITTRSLPLKINYIDVNVDNPFIFQVRMEEEGREPHILFAGRVLDVKELQ